VLELIVDTLDDLGESDTNSSDILTTIASKCERLRIYAIVGE
jgi:hypothetical protein